MEDNNKAPITAESLSLAGCFMVEKELLFCSVGLAAHPNRLWTPWRPNRSQNSPEQQHADARHQKSEEKRRAAPSGARDKDERSFLGLRQPKKSTSSFRDLCTVFMYVCTILYLIVLTMAHPTSLYCSHFQRISFFLLGNNPLRPLTTRAVHRISKL